MDCDQVIARLRTHAEDFHRAGVARLYLFGSVARNEARPDGDVDLFFDTDNPRFSLIVMVGSSPAMTIAQGSVGPTVC